VVNTKIDRLKLLEIGRILAQIARNPVRENWVKYCVFTVFDPAADFLCITYQSLTSQLFQTTQKERQCPQKFRPENCH
jgi:hypothetical protein